uniref:Ferric oxidoreductase domain-containing protein n=1 Tax=Cajanus cajan TaxID=3821 RepID=A0A151UCT1_CAJCA|nr:hypothetical protein KK1_021380 [Cajanus cajan]
MFIALLVWTFTASLHNAFAKVTPQSAAIYGEKVWQEKLWKAALILGVVGNICLAFMFFPVSRGSCVLPLLGLTSENSIKYHIWLGHMAMILFTAHAICYIICWALTDHISDELSNDNKLSNSKLGGQEFEVMNRIEKFEFFFFFLPSSCF